MEQSANCITCRSVQVKADYQCGVCHEAVCKKCSIFPTETFSYYKFVPEVLTHASYCSNCADTHLTEATATYNEIMEKAKEIIVFSSNETKITRLYSRKADPYHVSNCEDEEEALMRMSFQAVEDNYNCLLDIDYSKKKVVVGSHKKFIWSGTAIPVVLDLKRLRN